MSLAGPPKRSYHRTFPVPNRELSVEIRYRSGNRARNFWPGRTPTSTDVLASDFGSRLIIRYEFPGVLAPSYMVRAKGTRKVLLLLAAGRDRNSRRKRTGSRVAPDRTGCF